jgi:hypothetical protein
MDPGVDENQEPSEVIIIIIIIIEIDKNQVR